MALNLSTLTNSATSGDVLAEALTTADFLENVPVLRNLSRGSNKGGDAKQDVALNQPKALPLIKNPQGNLGGYLYIPNVAGNYATGPSVTIGSNQTWEGELDMVITQFGNFIQPMGGGFYSTGFGLIFYSNEKVSLMSKAVAGGEGNSDVTVGTPFNVKYGYDGTDVYVDIDGVRKFSNTAPSQAASITHNLQLSQQNNLSYSGNYAIQKAKLTVNNAVVFDCDFNGSTSIRHGDTKFQASVGGPVSLTRAGLDPVTVVKKDILRFDGVNSSLQGLFANNIDGGYMFAAFSVLGDGGETYGRIFSVHNSASAFDYTNFGFIFSLREQATNDLASYYNSTFNLKNDLFDADNGDILHEVRSKSGQHLVSVNGDSFVTNSRDTSSVDSNTFNISRSSDGGGQAAIDLEFLALFPATITDAQADSVRNYINNRNNVFSLIDSQGYYFYDAQKAPVGAITTGSASWNGRIVGSDNGDSDRYATQGTTNDAPVSDGYVVTFADNSDHLDIPSTTQAGWQVVGTSLGTFAYRVDSRAITELNLLGNAGGSRTVGELYGIILLPESASAADIESARSLLIDRGAADGATSSSYIGAWYLRQDLVEFKSVNMSAGTNFQGAWQDSGLTSFPSLDLSSGTTFLASWAGAPLQEFGSVDCSQATNFTSAWFLTTALTSFPAGAKLGTEASNVNFSSAWRSSGLTSFSTPLPTADILVASWRDCSSMTSFSVAELPLATDSRQSFLNCDFSTFSTEIPKSKAFQYCWSGCSSLTDFSADVFANWNPVSLYDSVFDEAWSNCTSLTAQSVENILVSIDASGKYATTTGASGGSALANAGIDIDYNVATGSLSAATDAAVTSLKAKGWSIVVNGVTL